MREYLSTEERNVICRAFLLFLLIVLVGITTVEKQLNSLTQMQNNIQVFSITRDQSGKYLAYFFGEAVSFEAVYPVGRIYLERNNRIVLANNNTMIVVPTIINFEAAPLRYWVRIWGVQFKEEAYKTKEALQKYGKIVAAALSDIFCNIKLQCKKLVDYIKSHSHDTGNKKYKYYYCKMYMYAV